MSGTKYDPTIAALSDLQGEENPWCDIHYQPMGGCFYTCGRPFPTLEAAMLYRDNNQRDDVKQAVRQARQRDRIARQREKRESEKA